MHTVVAAQCTGCELCLPVCPVDCISMVDAPAASIPPPTGRAAWSDERAAEAKQRYGFHRQRLGEAAPDADEPAAPSESSPADAEPDTTLLAAMPAGIDLQAVVAAALARTRRPAG